LADTRKTLRTSGTISANGAGWPRYALEPLRPCGPHCASRAGRTGNPIEPARPRRPSPAAAWATLPDQAEQLLLKPVRHQHWTHAVVDQHAPRKQLALQVHPEEQLAGSVNLQIDTGQQEAALLAGGLLQARADLRGPDRQGLVDGRAGRGLVKAVRAGGRGRERRRALLADRAHRFKQQVSLVAGRRPWRRAGRHNLHLGHQVAEGPHRVLAGLRRRLPGELHPKRLERARGRPGRVVACTGLARDRHQIDLALGITQVDVQRLPTRGERRAQVYSVSAQPAVQQRALVAVNPEPAPARAKSIAASHADLDIGVEGIGAYLEAADRAVAMQQQVAKPLLPGPMLLLLAKLVDAQDHAKGVVDPFIQREGPAVR